MSHISWTMMIATVCAGLLACTPGDDDPEPGDESTAVTAGITLTPGTTGTTGATGDVATTSTGTTGPGTETTAAAETAAVDGSSTSDPTTGGSDTGGSSTTEPAGANACTGKLYACGDGLDNDGDGAIDNADFECISPCDDDEGSFQTDLPGMAEDCRNDCFWDSDSGAGQDKCRYDLQCDAQDPGGQIMCGFAEVCPAETPAQCIDYCVPLIPNGCDCFGCCHIATPDGVQDYYLDSSDACALDDLEACNHCTFQEQCANPCEGCEVCFGESAPPPNCDPDDGGQCDEGVQPCTMGGDECPADHFCQTGCCQPLYIPG
jgi:hypothetical protein